ncbi:MAG: rhomboid family intramembrane serine protease [Halobaculum sp.]
MIDLPTVSRAAVVVAAVVTAVAVVGLERRAGSRPLAAVRRRLLFGLPLGTLTISAGVLAVYLFVQGGLNHWFDPVVTPFRAWTYLEPLGVLLAGFAHAGPGHLLGNLIGTLTLAPLAEYAYSHYPTRRGASTSRLRNNPYVRAFVLFPLGAVAVGLLGSVFSLGPVIGFSGVVFAFAGFALVRYPLGTVVALAAGDAVRVAWRAFRDPVTVASGRPTFVTPWWADIAIHGHALGLLFGVLAGGALAARRGIDLPAPRRLLAGTVLVAVSQALWAVYWFRGNGEFVLFRGVGVALVLLLALLVTTLSVDRLAVGRPIADGGGGSEDSPSDDRTTDERTADDDRTTDGDTGEDHSADDPAAAETTTGRSTLAPNWRPSGGVTPRSVALVTLLVVTATMSGVAVPTNLFTVGDQPLPGEAVEVRDYEVAYAEGVQNGMVSVVDLEGFGLSTNVKTSGVIVRNPERGVWTTVVSKGRLAFAGRQRVTVGGVGWRETILVERTGYTVVGGGTAYRVTVAHDGDRRVAFVSDPARAGPKIAGWNVSVAARDDRFLLVVSKGNRTHRVAVPGRNETVSAGPIRFVREEDSIFAVLGSEGNRTVVKVASVERYRGRGN